MAKAPNPEKILMKAKTLALSKSSFLAVIMLSMPTRFTEDIPTAATNGIDLLINPKFLVKIYEDEGIEACIGLMLHEALHPALDHCSANRRGSRNPRKWNVAGDQIINNALQDMHVRVPAGGLLDRKYAGDKWSTESVYADLPDNESGDDSGDIPGTGGDIVVNTDPAKEREVQQKTRDRLAQAAQVSKMNDEYGNLPGSLRRIIDEILNPKIDWRTYLRKWFSERARDDYSWARPSRRFLPHNLIMPGMYSEAMGHVVIVIDTSGSINNEIFREFMNEVQGVREMVRPTKTTIMCCDTEVSGVQEFAPEDDIRDYEPSGGGGTDFCPPFRYVEEHGIEPVVLLYFTDMLGSFPPEQPYPVIWAATTDIVGPIGETIRIDINS